jgi:tetratricopeptide (TPR) repeat protein
MDVALQARAGNEALAATQAWAESAPQATEPLRLQLQILTALRRLPEAGETLTRLIRLSPPDQRPGLITALPRLFDRAPDKREVAQLLETALAPYLTDPATRTAAVVTLGRGWLAAGEDEQAFALARQAALADPKAVGPALLAMELMPKLPAAERLVVDHLAQPVVEPALRLAYARTLTQAQRYADAVTQLDLAVKDRPDMAPPYLTLGALHLELEQYDAAEAALKRYVALVDTPEAAGGDTAADSDEADAHDGDEQPSQGLVQAWMLLAQVAEQRKDYPAAEAWLARIEDPQRALEVQARRALLMARQGQVDQAVATLRQVPERDDGDARAKLVAEAQLLRDVQQWQASYDAFDRARQRFPEDVDILYEQAMVAEKLGRLPDVERLLRQVIQLKPDHAHAHNALGYALADRGERLPEARALIQRALELMPGDPFITDSLGWVEYRMGNQAEAIRLLREAWKTRPDTEIGAHLGEVLWAAGQRDEARAVWRQARARDDDNAVLLETLARLQVGL